MIETAEEQRKRILEDNPGTRAEDYDLALALGYQPESWAGMWKLPADEPFTILGNRNVIIRELVTKNDGRATWMRNGERKIRAKLRPIPTTFSG